MSDSKVIGKHTPGPWINHGRDTHGLPHSMIEGGGALLAKVFSVHYGDLVQEISNANLIAAAPDLLEALQNMADSYEKYKIDSFLEDELESARAAIAKAKGLAQ